MNAKYAHQDYFGIQHYFAIQPNGDYVKVTLLIEETIGGINTGTNYTAPEVWAPITREEFIAAYEKAQTVINESFVTSCGFQEIKTGRLVSMDEGIE